MEEVIIRIADYIGNDKMYTIFNNSKALEALYSREIRYSIVRNGKRGHNFPLLNGDFIIVIPVGGFSGHHPDTKKQGLIL